MSNTLFIHASKISQEPAPHYANMLCAPVHKDMKVRMGTSYSNALGDNHQSCTFALIPSCKQFDDDTYEPFHVFILMHPHLKSELSQNECNRQLKSHTSTQKAT